MRSRTLAIVTLLAACAAVLPACGRFHRLRGELVRMETDVTIRGRIAGAPAGGARYAFVVSEPAPGVAQIVDAATLAADAGDFAFLLPVASDYLVGVFQDADGDTYAGADEPFWMTAEPVRFDAERRALLDVRLAAGGVRTAPPDLVAAVRRARAARSPLQLGSGHEIRIARGEVADLDAPRFSAAAGGVGLWEPLRFLRENGVGIYFVEPYDPDRVPVLFVPGASGSPQDFRFFFERLDRTRHQAWFLLYPSGLRLAASSRMLTNLITELHEQLGFERLAVVAHSMGGLVARDFVLAQAARGWVERFVTLSSPWGGHPAAALGVEYAPASVPSWIDMEPGSPFQQQLFARTLAPAVAHCLGFTFHGRSGVGLPRDNDGAVPVASQLRPEAQADAHRLRGFDETHTSVLRSPAALAFVEACLAEPGPR